MDILPIADTDQETARLEDQIEGVAGEWSPFEEQHGFSIDGVDLTTAILPAGWRNRLVEVANLNTAPPSGTPQFTGWCLDKEDLCVAKLCAFRDKDLNFVAALLDAGLVDAGLIATRLHTVPENHLPSIEPARKWLSAREPVGVPASQHPELRHLLNLRDAVPGPLSAQAPDATDTDHIAGRCAQSEADSTKLERFECAHEGAAVADPDPEGPAGAAHRISPGVLIEIPHPGAC